MLDVNFIDYLKKQAKEQKVEILRNNTLELLISLIKENNVTSILEIGCGIGYSSYMMVNSINYPLKITSIEKDKQRYELAKFNLKDELSIELINQDCFQYIPKQKFDLLILDGPKKKQIDLINQFIPYLNDNSYIFIDNLKLNNIANKSIKTKNDIKTLDELTKLKDYIQNQNLFKCEIYDIDDGVAILTKRVKKNDIKQVINKINLLKSLYEQYYSIMSDYPYKNINFSKENITSLLTSNSFNSLFNRMMITNLKILESIKNKQNFKQQFDQFRIKNINSIKDKINRYYQNESIKGKVCFNKCLNDLMGFRLLIDDDLNQLLSELNHLYEHDQKIKVLSKINENSSYKAIHIYIKLNNYCLPWELQIWNIKDKINNDLSHYEKYGRY